MNHHHYLILEHFHHSIKRNPVHMHSHSPVLSSPTPSCAALIAHARAVWMVERLLQHFRAWAMVVETMMAAVKVWVFEWKVYFISRASRISRPIRRICWWISLRCETMRWVKLSWRFLAWATGRIELSLSAVE